MKTTARIVLQIIAISLIVGITTALVIFVYGPTELFPGNTLTTKEILVASIKAGALASTLIIVWLGGSLFAGWARTQGPKYYFWKMPRR